MFFFFTMFELSIETLMQDINLVSTEEKALNLGMNQFQQHFLDFSGYPYSNERVKVKKSSTNSFPKSVQFPLDISIEDIKPKVMRTERWVRILRRVIINSTFRMFRTIKTPMQRTKKPLFQLDQPLEVQSIWLRTNWKKSTP